LVKTSSIFQKIPSRKYHNNKWNKLVKYHKKRKKKVGKGERVSKTREERFFGSRSFLFGKNLTNRNSCDILFECSKRARDAQQLNIIEKGKNKEHRMR